MTVLLPDWTVFWLAVPAVLLAGIGKGGFGSGAGFAATPILALAVGPATALGLMLPLLMLADVIALRSYWGRWHGPAALALVLGGLPGVLLGTVLARTVDPEVLRFLIGALAVAFVAWRLASARGWLVARPAPFRWRWALLAGTAGGFTSFVAHAGGPPVTMFLLSQRLDKTIFQATNVIAFWAINLVKAVPYGLLGFFTAETLVLDLWLAPMVAVGAGIGIWAHRRVPEQVFFTITYGLLLAAGSKLMWDAVT